MESVVIYVASYFVTCVAQTKHVKNEKIFCAEVHLLRVNQFYVILHQGRKIQETTSGKVSLQTFCKLQEKTPRLLFTRMLDSAEPADLEESIGEPAR